MVGCPRSIPSLLSHVHDGLTPCVDAQKVKTLARVDSDFTKERNSDLQRVHRNPDPNLHPFERAREYTRALNATKLDKVFAKPFVRALAGHKDGVYSIARSRTSLTHFVSGACDGGAPVIPSPRAARAQTC